VILGSSGVFIASGLGLALAPNYGTLLAMRLLVGLAIGAASQVRVPAAAVSPSAVAPAVAHAASPAASPAVSC